MTDTLTPEEIIIRIALALIAGLIIGFDSWRHQRNAGINLLCCSSYIHYDNDVDE